LKLKIKKNGKSIKNVSFDTFFFMHNVFIYYNIGHVSNEKKTKRPPPSEEQIEKAMNEMNNGSSLRKAA
jgi:hypothetical protein